MIRLDVYFLTIGDKCKHGPYEDKPLNEIAFGFTAIYGPPSSIRLFSFVKNKWQVEEIEEEDSYSFPFIVTTPIRLNFFVEESGIRVNIGNKKSFFHKHLCPVELISI